MFHFMKKGGFIVFLIAAGLSLMEGCSKDDAGTPSYDAIRTTFGSNIDPNDLLNYDDQPVPAYIIKDNTRGNVIVNAKATLGRVLFYDKKLSINNTVSCGSCHKQQFAFADTALVSSGVEGGVTVRHAMRLINSRFADEVRFFWNERAATLEAQTTMPIQDHAEMGYSGQNGRPGLADLISKLENTDYYKELFSFVYGDLNITESRMQECLAQFVRSIQSFDSKYDAGRVTAVNDAQTFANFTAIENQGKNLFLTPPQFDLTGSRIGGGLGCGGCHRAPEFDIDPQSGNNGIIGIINATGIDVENTRAPSLRDLVNGNGLPNGPMMHTGVIKTLQAVIGHYGTINQAPGNNNLDPRLLPNGSGQRLNLNATEVNAVMAFLKTLTGTAVYTDKRWSDPFL
jgi:cytochrome c peroxidase